MGDIFTNLAIVWGPHIVAIPQHHGARHLQGQLQRLLLVVIQHRQSSWRI